MFPDELCLDANIFVSALVTSETGYRWSSRLLMAIQENNSALYEPAVLVYEFLSAIHGKYHEEKCTKEALDEMVDLFFQLPLLFQWKSGLLKSTSETAHKLFLKKIYDCSYLSLAMSRNIPLVTTDGDLIKKGRTLYKKIFTPEEFLQSI